MNSLLCLVGLGNPGSEYIDNRHNVGFWLVDRLASKYKASFRFDKKFNAEVSKIKTEVGACWLLKPMTFMNESGRSVRNFINFYKFSMPQILIAHDELDLMPGIIRLKSNGGHGGHNGLRSVMNQTNSDCFHRIRIGIGHPGQKRNVSDFVLSRPTSIEKDEIEAGLDLFERNWLQIQSGDFQSAMRDLHSTSQ
tara:strand:+ start:4196 stop:4777 length:582 start_codon:yes stop_codon:yes gene_type:complete